MNVVADIADIVIAGFIMGKEIVPGLGDKNARNKAKEDNDKKNSFHLLV
jgi:hypothetical protein